MPIHIFSRILMPACNIVEQTSGFAKNRLPILLLSVFKARTAYKRRISEHIIDLIR